MNKLKLLLISIVLISCNNSEKENKILKQKEKTQIKVPNINEFIPNGYEIVECGSELNKIITDLNKDGISDFVVLIASNINYDEESFLDVKDLRLAIFEGQKDGSYKLKNQTGNLEVCFHITIKVVDENVISLRHQSMRHDYELKLRYENKYKNYMLIGSEYNNYGSGGEAGKNISKNYISGKRISTIYSKKAITSSINKELKPISILNYKDIYELISH